MELVLTADQEFFADTTAKFLDDKASPTDLRELRHDPAGFSPAYWRQGAELGWTSLLVSEEDGGGSISGGGVNDLALVAHQFGRYAAPGPLLATNVVAAALSRRGTAEQKADVLPGLLSGETIATWCWAEPPPDDRLGQVTVTASVTDDGYVLNGRKGPVEAGAQADHLLVVANADEGPVQLLVPAATRRGDGGRGRGPRSHAAVRRDPLRGRPGAPCLTRRRRGRPRQVTSNGSCSSPT